MTASVKAESTEEERQCTWTNWTSLSRWCCWKIHSPAVLSQGVLCEEMCYSDKWKRESVHRWLQRLKRSVHHVQLVAVSKEPCACGVPVQAPGDRLQIPGAPAPGHQSRMVPEWLQLFEEGLSGEPASPHPPLPPPTHTMSWWNNLKLSQKRKHLMIQRRVNRSSFHRQNPRDQTQASQLAGTDFFKISSRSRISRRLPKVGAGTVQMHNKTVFITYTNLVML